MTILQCIENEKDLSPEQKDVIKDFFKSICSLEKEEVKVFCEANYIYLKQKAHEYAKELFDQRELFISAFEVFISDKFSKERKGKYFSIQNINNSTENKVKLLKYLQGKGKSRQEIAEHFDVTVSILDSRIAELKSPTNHILGYKVSVELERATNRYDSTVHPVFLALNLTELYELLSMLEYHKNRTFEADLKAIKEDILSQLTDYAKNILCNAGINTDYTTQLRVFRQEKESDNLAYAMKSGRLCTVYLVGHDEPLIGVVKRDENNEAKYLFSPGKKGEPTISVSHEDIEKIEFSSR